MYFIKYLILIPALISYVNGVKVNMQGTIRMGTDILDILGTYLGKHNLDYRRSVPYSKETDSLYLLTKFSYVCRDLKFCDGDLEIFLNEYITLLTKSVETALKYKHLEDQASGKHEFENNLIQLLREIRKLLRATDMVVTEKNKHFFWVDVLKRISAMFQESAIEYTIEKLRGDIVKEIIRKMTHKIVVATATVESVYEMKICKDHNICQASFECTKTLKILFGSFKDLEIDKVRIFMKVFSKVLLNTNFYSHLSQNLTNHLQLVFDEMAYSNGVYTEPMSMKKLLNELHETVQARLSSVKSKKDHAGAANDDYLAHLILSDMDHFYDIQKYDPFHDFLSNFYDWLRTNNDIKIPIRDVLADVSTQINDSPEILKMKLLREVRVFLEISADSSKTEL